MELTLDNVEVKTSIKDLCWEAITDMETKGFTNIRCPECQSILDVNFIGPTHAGAVVSCKCGKIKRGFRGI